MATVAQLIKIVTLLVIAQVQVASVSSICLNDKHRPQFHFSPIANWLNDPNGMVYYQGVYHLFYQYYPNGTVWGPMHWGHTVSEDMVHWTEEPIALYPDSLGHIFSGSAVVDFNNASGLATSNNTAPIVALYTSAGAVQQQSLAFSNDLGASFTKYPANPILPNIDPVVPDIRDPKVIEYLPGVWLMLLAVGDKITFYESRNLIDWTEFSSFGGSPPVGAHGGVWECPDFLRFRYNGVDYWVLFVSINPGGPNGGSATQYFLGQFDGREFRAFSVEKDQWLDFGPDNYAGVTFSNEKLDRHVYVGWMNNWNYADKVPTEAWRGQMTIPRVLDLQFLDGKLKLVSWPAPELSSLRNSSQLYQLPNTPISIVPSVQFPLFEQVPFRNPLLELDLSFDLSQLAPDSVFVTCFYNELRQEICITYERVNNRVHFDRGLSGSIDFSPNFNARSTAERMTTSNTLELKIYLDVSSIEVFIDGGFSTLTGLFFPDIPFDTANVTMFSENSGSRLGLNSALIRGLNSIYDC